MRPQSLLLHRLKFLCVIILILDPILIISPKVMDIEYEATFENIDKDQMRAKLKQAGAELVKKEFEQKRVVFSQKAILYQQ